MNLKNNNIIDDDDMYINNETPEDNKNKYNCDDDFIFKEIVDNIFNSKSHVEFDSECIDVDMSISTHDDDYMVVDYKQENNYKKEIQIIEDYLENPDKYKNSEIKNDITVESNIIELNQNGANSSINENNTIATNIETITEESNEIKKLDVPDCENNDDTRSESSEEKHNNNITYAFSPNYETFRSDSFFECFNNELSINNSIACNTVSNTNTYDTKLNELTTSYMFDNEDLKKTDVFPFDDGINGYDKPIKPKNVMGRAGVIAVSAMMLISGSWVNTIFGL